MFHQPTQNNCVGVCYAHNAYIAIDKCNNLSLSDDEDQGGGEQDHKMEIVHGWDEIFPKYKEKLAAKEACYKAHGMELPPTPDKR